MILSLDTTGEFGSVALAREGRVIEELAVRAPEGFGHVLFDAVQRLLDRQGVGLSEIDCFAAAAGPGSFTGVRVGLAAVKGFAEAAGKPAVGVSNLRALAWFGTAELRAPVLDARRGEIYGAVYDARGGVVAAEVVMPFGAWVGSLPAGAELICADAAALGAELPVGLRVVTAPRELAGAVGVIAWEALAGGRAMDAAGLDANYVRRSDAELFWKE